MSTIGLSPAASRRNGLRAALMALAYVQAFIALIQSLKLIAPDVQIATGPLAELTTTVHLIVAPVLAVAALVFAARDQLPQAILALAAMALTTWASELMPAQFTGIALILVNVVRPIAVLATILAIRRNWLGLAAVLVASLWMLWAWITFLSDFLPFLLGVMIYGA